jgi:hypothetical protein
MLMVQLGDLRGGTRRSVIGGILRMSGLGHGAEMMFLEGDLQIGGNAIENGNNRETHTMEAVAETA